jgi:hypothetical protein
MRSTAFVLAALLTLAVALVGPAPASAQPELISGDLEAVNAPAQPTFVIRRPGSYVLSTGRRGGTDPAISIESSDVTLDLGGNTLFGPGGRQGVGIRVVGVTNVWITNGHLQRFGIGVMAVNSVNVTVDGLQIDGQDLGGAPPDVEIGVMLIDTRGARIAHNTITDTFLGVFVRGENSGGNQVVGNLITGGLNGELAICYNPAPDATAGGPDGDLVADNLVSHFRRAISLSADSTGNIVRDNALAYFDLGIVEATPGSNLIVDNDETQVTP